jgi:hypothetical protein
MATKAAKSSEIVMSQANVDNKKTKETRKRTAREADWDNLDDSVFEQAAVVLHEAPALQSAQVNQPLEFVEPKRPKKDTPRKKK